MIVKAGILCGKNRVLDVSRHILQANEVAAFLAEFAHQLTVGAPNAKRHAGTVVGERVDRRKLPVDESKDKNGKQNGGGGAGGGDAEEPFEERGSARTAG